MLTTFVLGAGFSRAAALPLGDELFARLIARAKTTHLYKNFVSRDLDRFRRFLEHTTGSRCRLSSIKFEEFLSFLDIEHSLRLSGIDTWSHEGNKTQLIVRNLIAAELWFAQRRAPAEAISLYDDFASHLDSTDVVITFNYDTLLEESLERIAKPYRLFPARVERSDSGWHYKPADNEVSILKMHGSIDWFDRSGFDDQSREWDARGFGTPPDEVFSRDDLELRPLIDEPYPETSPLVAIYKLRNLARYLEGATMVRNAPLLISPSLNKILYASPLREFWEGFGSGAQYGSKVVIIGFSLPRHDDYVRQALYRLTRNFQFGDRTANTRKTKLTLVDRRSTAEDIDEYRYTYRFIDWRRANVVLSGFSRDTFASIFDARDVRRP